MSATIKAYKGMGMEGSTARWYDKTTRRDMHEFKALAARIVAELAPAAQVLEVAPGPGFLSIELARLGFEVRALDISKTFVEIARHNAVSEGVKARFELGNAAALPLGDSSVDFAVCRAAFKNFSEPVKALAELRRVVRPGGTALVIDLRRDVDFAAIRRYIASTGLGLLNRLFMGITFRAMLIPRAYRIPEFERMAREAGWTNPAIESSQIGFEAWLKG